MMTRWFAKRFLHPDIVAKYSYIFLWDEDLGVEDFNPQKYVDQNPIFYMHLNMSLTQIFLKHAHKSGICCILY